MLKTLTWLVCACATLPVLAQTAAPSTEQMIEQLKAPRSRSLRNLTVEAAPPPAPTESGVPATPASPAATTPRPAPMATAQAPAARPSLSLLIQFDFDSARVRPESRPALANLAQALQSTELRDSRFAIEGHTDAQGSADYNRKLSQQRAQAVRELLITSGVEDGRLVAAGKGSSELANRSQPLAAENRRVRIVNLD